MARRFQFQGPSGTAGMPLYASLTVQCREPNFDYIDPSSHVGVTAGIVTFHNVQLGTIVPVSATQVMATNTSAENIVSLH